MVDMPLDASSRFRYWPLNPDGPLPKLVYDADFLFESISCIANSNSGFRWRNTRKALEDLAVQLFGSLPEEINHLHLPADKIRHLLPLVLDTPKGRNLFIKIPLCWDSAKYVNGPRIRKNEIIKDYAGNFPSFIWTSFRFNQAMFGLRDWFDQVCYLKSDMKYLSLEKFSVSLVAGSAPIRDPNFYRALIAYCGLEDQQTSVEFFRLVEGEGSPLLAQVVELEALSPILLNESGVTNAVVTAASAGQVWPRIDDEDSLYVDVCVPICPPYLREMQSKINVTCTDTERDRQLLLASLEYISGDLISSLDRKAIEGLLSSIGSMMNSVTALAELQGRFNQEKACFLSQIIAPLGLPVAEIALLDEKAQAASVDEISEFVVLLDLCTKLGDDSKDLIQSFRSRLRLGASLQECSASLTLSRDRLATRISLEKFCAQAQDRLKHPVSLDEWKLWLTKLDPEEICALLDRTVEPKHGLLRCFLARLLGERSWERYANWFETSMRSGDRLESMQMALRWVDPLQLESLAKEYPSFIRFVVCELYRDGMTSRSSAPMWVIQRLIDADVFGQPLFEFFQAALPILSQRGSVLDLVQSLRTKEAKESSLEHASKELEYFIQTPSGMVGNFYRLREAARHQFFVPLLRDKKIDDNKIQSLLSGWDTDVLADNVEEIAEQRYPSLYIDYRHRQQLTRFLQEGRALLSNYISSKPAVEAAGHDLTSPLQKSFRHLIDVSTTGDLTIGTINWLQHEIVDLANCSLSDEAQILSSLQAESVLSAFLSPTDVRWAESKLPVPAIYSGSGRPLAAQVALEVASNWAGLEQYGAAEIIKTLLVQGRYGQVRQYLDRPEIDANIKENGLVMLEQEILAVRSAVEQELQVHSTQLGALAENCESYRLAFDALERDEIADARLYAAMVSEEVKLEQRRQRIAEESRDPAIQKEKGRLSELIRVAGGAVDIGGSTIDDLKALLQGLLVVSASKRRHLLPIEDFLSSRHSRLVEVGVDTEGLESLIADQRYWLSTELAGHLIESTNISLTLEYFKGWLDSERDGEIRKIKLIIDWFFLQVRRAIASIKETDDFGEVDDQLERLLGYCLAVSSSVDNTLIQLRELDEALGLFADNNGGVQDDLSEEYRKLIVALEKSNWENILYWSTRLVGRSDSVNDTRYERRLAQSARRVAFCVTEANLGAADIQELLAAADALTTRSLLDFLPPSTVLEAAKLITIRLGREGASDTDEQIEKALLSRLDGARSWPPLEALEKFISAPFGGAFLSYLWQTVTARSAKPGLDRGALLHFLYRNGLTEAISFLAQKYDSKTHISIERMVELRQIAENRPELLGIAQMFSETVMKQASEPFRRLAERLIKAPVQSEPKLEVEVEGIPQVVEDITGQLCIEVPLVIRPISTVIANSFARIGPGADVSFEKGQQYIRMTDQPIYEQIVHPVKIVLGSSWKSQSLHSFPLTIEASTIVDQKISTSIDVTVKLQEGSLRHHYSVKADDLDDLFPGNHLSVRIGPMLIGRSQELGDLERLLVRTAHPSPVLVTGLRRIGKTSLVRTLHENLRTPGMSEALSIYVVIGSKGDRFATSKQSVAREFFECLKGAIDKSVLTNDANGPLKTRLTESWSALEVSKQLEGCWVEDSLSDSIAQLADWVSKRVGSTGGRVVFIIDEAESLIYAMLASHEKSLQLSSLMHSLRELSQNHSNAAILLCSSNNIDRLVDSYTDAFFGSCHHLRLGGIFDFEDARQIIAPTQIGKYLSYSEEVVRYIIDICQGMPLAMSLVSAATAWIVRTGYVERHHIRRALSALLDESDAGMPATLRRWRILEPVNKLLDLEGAVEKSRLFVLLYRLAAQSSLINQDARFFMVINEELRAVLAPDEWRERVARLQSLDLVSAAGAGVFRFKVPIFAEAMRINQLQRYYGELESCR